MHIILLLVFPFFQASRILISSLNLNLLFKFKFKFIIYDVLNYLYH